MDARRVAAGMAVLASLLAPAAARAADGYLAPLGCLGPVAGCDQAVPSGFDAFAGLFEVVASDDGTNAYGLSQCCAGIEVHQTALTRLRRASNGRLSFSGCLADPPGGGCAALPPAVVPESIAVAGSDVYVGGEGTIAHLRPQGDGLGLVDCVGTADGCKRLPAGNDALAQERRIVQLVLAPDGHDLYALSDGGVVHLRRTSDGRLAYGSCYGLDEQCAFPTYLCGLECDNPPSLFAVKAMALSPDGATMYIGSGIEAETHNMVARLRRDADGRLTYADCFGQGVDFCRPMPAGVTGLAGIRDLAVAPSGDVYVTATSSSVPTETALVHLRPAAGGSLGFADCIGAAAGCRRFPWSVVPPENLWYVLAAPDGRSLYAAERGGAPIYHFTLGDTGRPSYASCLAGSVRCTFVRLGGENPDRPTIAPDGRNVYVPAAGSAVALTRRLTPPFATGAPPTAETGGVYNVSFNSVDFDVPYVTAGDDDAVYWMDFGRTASYGIGVVPGQFVEAGHRSSTTSSSGSILGLAQNTTYHYRVVARSLAGTVYGEDRTFTTKANGPYGPTIDWPPMPDVSTPTTASIRAQISPGFLPTHYWIEYGETTDYGATADGGDITPEGGYTGFTGGGAKLVGLRPHTTYHFRFVASNAQGTTYGRDWSVTTTTRGVLAPAPAIRAGAPLAAGAGSITLSGAVNPLGNATRYRFEVARSDSGPWTATPIQNAGAGSADVPVTARIDGLTPHARYLSRLVAIRAAETVTTDVRAFLAPSG